MKDNTFTKDFWFSLLFYALIIIVICYLPYCFTHNYLEKINCDFTETGQIGDTIGGTMGPFVAIAASILTFLAFWVQYKANILQRKDIALERFESNLFQMIQVQEEITNNLSYTPEDGADRHFGNVFKGRDVFKILYSEKGWNETWGIQDEIKEGGRTAYIEDKDIYILDHYFRHLYRIIKYIDEAEILKNNTKEKYKYTSIVRSGLSYYELLMLFYNCLSTNGVDKFKPLIEKYTLFNNLRLDLLATEEDKSLYIAVRNGEKEKEGEYNQGAFIFKDDSPNNDESFIAKIQHFLCFSKLA